MALVKYGGGIVAMSGSIAGNVHARNRSGNYVRARTVPINPNTARQQLARNSVAFLCDQWSSVLTATQRTAWNLYAASVAMKNKLGETIYLSGFNHYVRSNTILKMLGQTLVAAGPTIFELPEHDPLFAVTASEATQLVSVVFDDAAAWCDEDDAFMFTFQGKPQNAQINFFDGPWRIMDMIAGDSVTPPTTPETQTSPFILTEGQRLWTYGRIIRADGRLSEKFRADTFCTS